MFGEINSRAQINILKEYIDRHEDEKSAFNAWYENRYFGDD